MRRLNLFIICLLTPFVGIAIALVGFEERAHSMDLPLETINHSLDIVENSLYGIQQNVSFIYESIIEQELQFREQQRMLEELATQSQEQRQLSDHIYEERILAMLGPPIGIHSSERVEVKVFKLDELGYRGYIAKVKLFDPSVFRVVLGKDKLGERETTSQAVERTGAVLGINGGGFYQLVQGGKQYTLPIANTVIDGRLVNGFHPTYEDIFFSGIRKDGTLIGGVFSEQNELMDLKPWQGVSFVPILIQDGKPVPLPPKWVNTRHPRTIIGEYANGDLILIVVDGRQSDWSSGVTLERLQIKLIELGVKEGYNLDGGGSSVFIFNGEVLNRPSDGRQRLMPTNIVIMP